MYIVKIIWWHWGQNTNETSQQKRLEDLQKQNQKLLDIFYNLKDNR